MSAKLSIITQRDKIRKVRESWFSIYQRKPDLAVTAWSDRTFRDVRCALLALDVDACSEQDIDAAIGVPCWAELTCDVCHSSVTLVVRVGDADDAIHICPKCLDDAAALARAAAG